LIRGWVMFGSTGNSTSFAGGESGGVGPLEDFLADWFLEPYSGPIVAAGSLCVGKVRRLAVRDQSEDNGRDLASEICADGCIIPLDL
jgi:hypothetical protein